MPTPTIKIGSTFLQALGGLVKFWSKTKKADSYISYTNAARVEPIAILDESVVQLPYISDVMQSLNAIFAGYYLQAAAMTATIGDISVGKMIGHLNPSRSYLASIESHQQQLADEPIDNAALEALIGQKMNYDHDYDFGLPSMEALSTGNPESPNQRQTQAQRAARQKIKDAADKRHAKRSNFKKSVTKARWNVARPLGKGARKADKITERGTHATAVGISDKLNKGLNEAVNLAVGRVYNVDLQSDGNKASIPVSIRLLATECDTDLLVHILSDGSRIKNSTSKERNFAKRLGDLKFWRDIVATSDLIDEHRKALMKDTNGVYREILKRRRGNMKASISSGKPSVGTASNIVVTTSDTIKELEREIGGSFKNPKYRKKIFDKSYLFIVAVINPDYDHITFYYRGINLPTEMSLRDVKMSNKGSNNDVLDILRAFQMGEAPSF